MSPRGEKISVSSRNLRTIDTLTKQIDKVGTTSAPKKKEPRFRGGKMSRTASNGGGGGGVFGGWGGGGGGGGGGKK